MLAAQCLFTYAPVMNKLFHTAPIDAEAWLELRQKFCYPEGG